ncbi:MAG: hypothetical protein BroJett040_03600 [Oligoflexia bacterium]|nr:MAG: hypothetical protein BroJett040_03600 [Oligoflexia bacterium]
MASSTTESSLKEKLYPFGGELHISPDKKFSETVLIVPFYGAKKPSLARHVNFLAELGYDVVIFNLQREPRNWKLINHLFSSEMQLGLKHIWADQIQAMLNAIPGRKIVYAFSNPSASAIEAIARRNAYDIAGLVCDSGPSGDLFKSMIAYFTTEEPIRLSPLKLVASAATTLIWHPQFKIAFHEDLAKLPHHFRILSIRGWKDKIITVDQIDKVFEPHQHLDWQKLSLPQAAHLNGLKDFRAEYEKPVSEFLKEISTPTYDGRTNE